MISIRYLVKVPSHFKGHCASVSDRRDMLVEVFMGRKKNILVKWRVSRL